MATLVDDPDRQPMTRPNHQLVVDRIGGSFALLSPVTGAIVLTNEFGLSISKGWAQGLNPAQIATEIAETPDEIPEALDAVHAVLGSWQTAGLLDQQIAPFPEPVPYRRVMAQPLVFGGDGGIASCYINDPVLAEQMQTILGHMIPQPHAPIVRFDAVQENGGFAIFRDGTALSGRISLDAARFVLLREIATTVIGAKEVAAVFHAGCVVRNGHALILCGDSGQGKSTLTFGLVDAGCAYFGDDHIPLHANGTEAIAYPTTAGVKQGSWQLPEILSLQQKFGLTLHSPRVGVRYIPLHLAGGPETGNRTPIRALVFPKYAPGSPLSMERIPPEQALQEALRAGSRLSGSHSGNVAPLANLLNHVPTYRITYSSSDQSVPACLDLLTNPLP